MVVMMVELKMEGMILGDVMMLIKKGGWNGAIKENPYQIKTIIPKYKRI